MSNSMAYVTTICFVFSTLSSTNSEIITTPVSNATLAYSTYRHTEDLTSKITNTVVDQISNTETSSTNITVTITEKPLTNATEEGAVDSENSNDLGTVIESDTEADTEENSTEDSDSEVGNTTKRTTKADRNREPWSMKDALKDIAYYLRSYKFNEYDRRYETNPEGAPRRFFKEFPRPPLRSLHWEVHRYCEPSFKECVDFLRKRIRHVSLKRTDDTAVVMQEQHWTFNNNSQQIEQIEDECKKLRTVGDTRADPFEGPLERFQWRVTASYFMCWYTMRQEPQLKFLFDHCDNFAYCFDETRVPSNKDIRANDSLPYGCALYSFCPDPCCPMKHLGHSETCWDSTENPCYSSNPAGGRECFTNRTKNIEFRDIVLNRWNVTCRCPKGYEWNSRFGMCVDVDECALEQHNCGGEAQACVNLQGGFRCACIWGHVWNPTSKECIASKALRLIKLTHKPKDENESEQSESLIRKLTKFFRKSAASALVPDKITVFVSRLLFLLLCLRLF